MGSHLRWAWSWAAGPLPGCAERQSSPVGATRMLGGNGRPFTSRGRRCLESSFRGLKYLMLLESESQAAAGLLP